MAEAMSFASGASFRQHLDPFNGPDALRITAPAGTPGQNCDESDFIAVRRRLSTALPLTGILAGPIQDTLKSATIELRFIFPQVKPRKEMRNTRQLSIS